jgi:hypothetical protein
VITQVFISGTAGPYYDDRLLIGSVLVRPALIQPPQVWPVSGYTDRIKIGPTGPNDNPVIIFAAQGVTGPTGPSGLGVTGSTGPKVLWPMFVFGA